MVGSNLLRYQPEQSFCIFDFESEGLNLYDSRPWEIAWAIANLKDGIKSIHVEMIRWPNLRMDESNPSFRHFDRARYEREARDPHEVWSEFAPCIYGGVNRSVGHNILSYDSAMISVWRRGMGLRPDHSWIYNPPLLDTLCLSKAFKSQWIPDLSSPEATVAWQYRCYHQRLAKGVKTKLGVMCAEFGIEYDQGRAHEAKYDISVNWEVAKKLIWAVEI